MAFLGLYLIIFKFVELKFGSFDLEVVFVFIKFGRLNLFMPLDNKAFCFKHSDRK